MTAEKKTKDLTIQERLCNLRKWMLEEDLDMRAPADTVDPELASSEITRLQRRVEELERERDNLKLQAQCHSMEARTQASTVNEIYQECTGKTGEPGNWSGAEPVRKALKDARNAALEEAAEVCEKYAGYRTEHVALQIRGLKTNDQEAALTELARLGQEIEGEHMGASFTYDDEVGAYYFQPKLRAEPPYERQMHTVAIVDVAQDGTLAGIEIIDAEVPPPFKTED